MDEHCRSHHCRDHGFHPPAMDRRRLLTGGVAALALSTLARPALSQNGGTATSSPSGDGIIDVHHHFSPPDYVKAMESHGIHDVPLSQWSVARSLEDMDRSGVAKAMLSITTPGIWFGDPAEARKLARLCNEYGAQLVRDHPGRFGLFAALPLPDVEGSLREIDYALDTLKADGVGLLTSFGDVWLGNPAFDPVMAELNRRRALIYTHPTVANCCRGLIPVLPQSTIEFQTDTSRAIGSVIFTGTAARYPDVNWIFSHGGGTVPFLFERFVRLPSLDPKVRPNVPRGVEFELRRFFYDIAQVADAEALSALTRMVPTQQILFGTDYPYRTAADHVAGLRSFFTSPTDQRLVERGNTVALLAERRLPQ